ncbi:hypothetical protein [Rhodanobacter caeni]|uniref:Uncharacterized protein n=1 Tax=Rhodanobacter caeni TaxID=657654 RepID=A0ABN0USQ9_9GAMM
MSGPVEVLAVLTHHANGLRLGPKLTRAQFERVADDLERVHAAVAELIKDHKALYKHYVSTLESARDKIIDLGGDCDPVDRMEQSDPVLAQSRAILARVGGAS